MISFPAPFLILCCFCVIFFRYKNELQKEDKDRLRDLLEKQKHKLVRASNLMGFFSSVPNFWPWLILFPPILQVTPEIHRELEHSRNRGEKEEDFMSIYILYIFHLLTPLVFLKVDAWHGIYSLTHVWS